MVAVVVGVQDGDKLQFFLPQIVENGQGIAGVDNRGVEVVANHPYIVIGECADRNNAR
jgi:hypothetical protein